MKRNTPLKRYTPLRGNPSKIREWKSKRVPMAARNQVRSAEERVYLRERPAFLAAHPICPVTGERTTQLHHSAKREGGWLLLKRYWIAVSLTGHSIIEDNKKWAEGVGLMVRIRESYSDHIRHLESRGDSLEEPIFYDNWNNETLWPKIN